VPVLLGRLVRREALEPVVEILDQAGLCVIDVDRRRDVHRVDETEPVLDPGAADEVLDVGRDVHVIAAVRGLEPEVVGRVLHDPATTGFDS
jgi:hypothetical protein